MSASEVPDERRLSVVIPTWNEEVRIAATIEAAKRGLRPGDEILVVDGGSPDGTVAIARAAGARVVLSRKGRGRQLDRGAREAGGEVLLFLHADTILPPDFRSALDEALAEPGVRWGRFDLGFLEPGPVLGLLALLINWRSRLFCSATGDQAIFVLRPAFEAAGGIREEHLFEDVDLVRRLRKQGAMAIPKGRVRTSARRWQSEGLVRTTLRMWVLKSLYLLGVPARSLAARYGDRR